MFGIVLGAVTRIVWCATSIAPSHFFGEYLLACLITLKSILIPVALLLAFVLSFFITREKNGISKKLALISELLGIALFLLAIMSPRLSDVLNPVCETKKNRHFDLAMNPNLDMVFSAENYLPEYRVTTNSMGFRDVEWPGSEDGKKRIMLVGDSFIFGSGVQQDELLARQLERELKDHQRNVRVYNVGQPGWNLAQEVEAIQSLADILHPDLILISHLPGNDLWPVDPLFNHSINNKFDFEAAINLRKQQVAQWHEREYELPELLDPYLRTLEILRRWAENRPIDVFLYTHGPTPYHLEPVESSLNVFVRCFPDWQNDEDNFYVNDGHPTPLGNRFLAELLAPFVIELLEVQTLPPDEAKEAREQFKSLWKSPCLPNVPILPDEKWIIPGGKEEVIEAFFRNSWVEAFHGEINRIAIEKTRITATLDTPMGPRTATLEHSCTDDERCHTCTRGCICFDTLSTAETTILQRACPSFPPNLWIETKQ